MKTPAQFSANSQFASFERRIAASLFVRLLTVLRCGLAFKCAAVLTAAQYQFEQLCSFSTIDINIASLIVGKNDVLYGTTIQGGLDFGNSGLLYAMRADGSDFKIIHYFDFPLGVHRYGVIYYQGADEALYGVVKTGLSTENAGIFKINTDGSEYTILRTFSGPGIVAPEHLIQGSDTTVYGVLGTTLFAMNPDGSNYKTISNETNLIAALLQGRDGKLYASLYPNSTGGSIVRFSTDGTAREVIHAFAGWQWAYTLIQSGDGLLYGTALAATFSLSPENGAYTELSPTAPAAWLGIEGPNGARYDFSGDTVFGVVGTDNRHTALHDFAIPPVRPEALAQAEDGSLLSYPDYPYPLDGILRLDTRGNLHDDLTTWNDMLPSFVDTLIFDHDSIYAVSDSLIFRANLDGSGFQVLHSFENFLGGGPFISSLIDGLDGFLYGITYGGTAQVLFQRLFKIAKDGTDLKILHDFSPEDSRRNVSLTKGNFLSGVTYAGIWYRIAKDGTGYHELTFDNAPVTLSAGTDESIYGTAGGNTVFRMNLDGSGYQILHTLAADGSEGSSLGSVFEADDGFLYGTASSGTVFRLRPDGANFEVIYRFSNELTEMPSRLIKGFDGSLYGATTLGGQFGSGILFALRPPVPPPPRMLGLKRDSLEVTIRFSSSVFSTNAVLRSESVSGPWQLFTNTIAPLNSVGTITDSIASPARFYRIGRN